MVNRKRSMPRAIYMVNRDAQCVENKTINITNPIDEEKDLSTTDVDSVSSSESSVSDDKHISLLTEQIKELRAEYISIQSSFLTMTSISFCGYGLILYYAFNLDKELGNAINYVFLCLPFLFGISFLNILKYTIRMLGMGAYIGYLEKTINTIAKKNIYMWHSKLVYVNGYNFVGIASIPCNIAIFVVAFIKFKDNMDKLLAGNNTFTFYALLIFSILVIGIIIFSLVVCATQYHAVKYSIEDINNSDTDKDTSPFLLWPPKIFQK